jgi:hypothetical protein
MKYQVHETSVLKPYVSAYEAAKKQLEQYYEMGMFPNSVINDIDLKKGQFEEGSIYFNYEQDGVRKSVRVIPYMNQRLGMHGFKHPIVIDTKDMSTTVIFNANAYGQLGVDGIVKIRQSSMHQFNFMISYSVLLGKIACGQINKQTVISLGTLAANAFSVCMSQALARSYSLDYSVQLNIQVVCAYFYYAVGLGCSMEEATELSSISTKVSIDQIKEMINENDFESMIDIPSLATMIGKSCKSERLSDLKPIVLYTMLKQYWVGENGAEMICAAYEIPLLWCFLCYSAMEHVIYKKNQLSDVLKISSKHFDAQQLSYGMRKILSNEGN